MFVSTAANLNASGFSFTFTRSSLLKQSKVWSFYCILPQARKWGSAVGYVDGKLTLAGGGDYGDNTIEVSFYIQHIFFYKSFCHKLKFLISISLQPDGVNLWFI